MLLGPVPIQSSNGGGAASGWLLCVFAVANASFVALLVGSQWRALRRAAHLSGLGRAASWWCCCCCSCLSASAGADSPAARYAERAHRVAAAKALKVSPSSQSLFMISQQQQQARQQQQQLYGMQQQQQQHYGHAYSASGSQQLAQYAPQQHMYQPIGQQHIYDSTSNLNSLVEAHPQHHHTMQQPLPRTLNAMHLQQHHHHQQVHSFTMGRQEFAADASDGPLVALGPACNAHQQANNGYADSLKAAMMNEQQLRYNQRVQQQQQHHAFVIDAAAHNKQQQQQQHQNIYDVANFALNQ